MLEQLLHIDGQILLWIQEYLRFPALTSVMKDITNLGNAGILWILITIVLLLDKKTRNVGYMSALALIGSLIVDNILLKNLVARTRPFDVNTAVQLLVAKPRDYSFPSGHTATAFMTATMLTKEYGHISPWIGIGAYSVATATGLMRMANNKHWLSDVLTGAGIGILADLIFNDKGIHYYDIADNCSVDDAPTFVGLYLGLNAMPGNYSLPGNSSLQFSSGSTAGLEGAYFFNPYIGVGGRLAVSNNAVIYKGHALDETLDMFLVHAGAYFSYPIMSRLLIGSKALVGMSFCNQMKTSEYAIGKNCGAGLGTGVSLTFRARSNLGIRMFADYNLSFNRISPAKSTSHLIVIGGSVNVIF
mgnify:CR=1 FL=1